MKRPHEELSRVEFDKLARLMFPHATVAWQDVPQHLEPPDWYMTLDGRRYAVEATTIVDFLSVTPSTKLSAPNVMVSLTDFVKEVENVAKDRGILSGAYVISLSPVPNLSQNREVLLEKFLAYIRRTQLDPSAPEETLGYIREHRTSIKKAHDKKDYVTAGISLGVKWDGEARDDLLELVSGALATKAHKLSAISEPIILLLLDDYGYSHMSDWGSVVSLCPDRVRFCCVCRIRPPDKTSIIWANSPEWNSDLAG